MSCVKSIAAVDDVEAILEGLEMDLKVVKQEVDASPEKTGRWLIAKI